MKPELSSMRMLLRAIPIIFFCSTGSLGQVVPFPTARNYAEPETEPPEHALDMQRMLVEVSFVPEQGLVKGKVTHIFVPLRSQVDSFFFNGPGIHILKATLNNRPLSYRVSSEGITAYFRPPLHWDSVDSITFVYEATPRQGLYFVGWNDTKNIHRKQIWTQGQGISNRCWVPCYDEQNDKLVTETIVTFDSSYQVLSNGTKTEERDNGDGTKTWHYMMSHPHSSYLVMIGIGKYGVKSVFSKSRIPVHLWYYPEYPERVEPTFLYSAQAIDFMESETGVPYPWESYSQIPVADFLYGGMENTTATVFGDYHFVDRREFLDHNYIDINVHELAHQWFGDYVTGRSGRSAWLHESFATYYTKLFRKSFFGEDDYEWTRRSEQNAALAASLQNRLPILHSQAGGARVYQKGSAVLDMMAYAFGKAELKRVIAYYLKHHPYANVETNDLYQAFQDTLGVSPRWFFEEWIYRGGEPEYEVGYQDITAPGGDSRRTEITIKQVQLTDELVGLFRMPIVCEVHYADGSLDSVSADVKEQTQKVIIPNKGKKEIAFVLFDPGSRVLKKVMFEKSFRELSSQVLFARHMIDRYDALVAMRPIDAGTKHDLLVETFRRETFHAIRSEIVSQLMIDPDPKSVQLIRAALRDTDAKVRASVIENAADIPEALRSQYEMLLQDSSLHIIALALRKLSDCFPGNVSRYLAMTGGLNGSGNEIKVLWHELNASHGSRSSLDSLVEYAGPSYEYHTRVNALESLKRLNFMNDSLLPNLFEAMLHFNGRLRGPATAVAVYFSQQSVLKDRLKAYYGSRSWEPWQREILKNVIE